MTAPTTDVIQAIRDAISTDAAGRLGGAWTYVRLASAVEAVVKVHRPHRIYDDCGHQPHEYAEDGSVPEGMVELEGIGLVCEAGYVYSICTACCCDVDGYQHVVCTDEHRTVQVGQVLVKSPDDPAVACWPCHTVRAIAEALGAQP